MDTVDNQTFKTIRDRMDALIDARRTQPDKRGTWNKLCTALRDMATNADDIRYITTAFAEIEQEERLRFWDNDFFETLITSADLDDYIRPSPNPYAGPAVPFPGQIISTTGATTAQSLNNTQVLMAQQLGVSPKTYAKIIDTIDKKEGKNLA